MVPAPACIAAVPVPLIVVLRSSVCNVEMLSPPCCTNAQVDPRFTVALRRPTVTKSLTHPACRNTRPHNVASLVLPLGMLMVTFSQLNELLPSATRCDAVPLGVAIMLSVHVWPSLPNESKCSVLDLNGRLVMFAVSGSASPSLTTISQVG